jgi:hypothetical protein
MKLIAIKSRNESSSQVKQCENACSAAFEANKRRFGTLRLMTVCRLYLSRFVPKSDLNRGERCEKANKSDAESLFALFERKTAKRKVHSYYYHYYHHYIVCEAVRGERERERAEDAVFLK